MYLNPPCSNQQEFLERLYNGEVFRVFKREVNVNTKDRTFKRHGRSNVVLEDGTEVIVRISNGKVYDITSIKSHMDRPLSREAPMPAPVEVYTEEKETSFKDLLSHMQIVESKLATKTERKFEEDAWNEVYNNISLT